MLEENGGADSLEFSQELLAAGASKSGGGFVPFFARFNRVAALPPLRANSAYYVKVWGVI